MKTSETLLLCGQLGAYTLKHASLDAEYKALFIELLFLLEKAMYKASLPADRRHLSKQIPIVMTNLEMKMPLSWNTSVVHIFVFHTVATLEAGGPFISSNMLDVERFQTEVKKLLRAKNHPMKSIVNNYEILQVSIHLACFVRKPFTVLVHVPC
jgi:hypothetical protein